MLKWSDVLSRLIPWLDSDDPEERRQLAEETADMAREAHEQASMIADQAAYLVHRGQINGFSRQLRLGFEQRIAGE